MSWAVLIISNDKLWGFFNICFVVQFYSEFLGDWRPKICLTVQIVLAVKEHFLIPVRTCCGSSSELTEGQIFWQNESHPSNTRSKEHLSQIDAVEFFFESERNLEIRKSQSKMCLPMLYEEANWFKNKKHCSISKLTSDSVWSCSYTFCFHSIHDALGPHFCISVLMGLLPHNWWTCCNESLGIRIVFEFFPRVWENRTPKRWPM